MSAADKILVVSSSVILLILDWLAFYDWLEAHTIRDWGMLVATCLVLTEFARQYWNTRSRA